ncbi:MAG: hypothetical protein ACP5QG_03800, partial [candidate division WOR-3 bacterium]
CGEPHLFGDAGSLMSGARTPNLFGELLAKGNRWTYTIYYQYEDAKELRFEITEKTETGFILENPGETQILHLSGDTLWLTNESSYSAGGKSEVLLVGPMKNWAAWDWAGGRAWISCTEEITVIAGQFSCIRIARKRKFISGPINMDEEIIEWWARGIGMVKKTRVLKGETGRSGWTWELVDYMIK